MKTLIELYNYAIEQEVKIRNLYLLLEKSFKSEDLQNIFKRLAVIEKGHADKLSKMFKEKFPGESLNVNPDELPAYSNKHDLSDAKSVFLFAIEEEQKAQKKYQELAELETDSNIKEFLRALAEEESKHADLLEKEIEKMEGILIWYDETELNGLFEY